MSTQGEVTKNIAVLSRTIVSVGILSGLNYYQGRTALRAALFLMDEIDAGRATDEDDLAHRATEFIQQELSQLPPEQRGYKEGK